MIDIEKVAALYDPQLDRFRRNETSGTSKNIL